MIVPANRMTYLTDTFIVKDVQYFLTDENPDYGICTNYKTCIKCGHHYNKDYYYCELCGEEHRGFERFTLKDGNYETTIEQKDFKRFNPYNGYPFDLTKETLETKFREYHERKTKECMEQL